MDFRLFGPFEVWHYGARIDPGDLQQRYVLAILLINANQAVSRDHLHECLWRGQEQPKSEVIAAYIARLRKFFRATPDVEIDKTPTGYLLRVDEDRIDTVRFTRLCAIARRSTDPADAIRLFGEALDLWRGRFLSDMEIDRVGGPVVVPSEDARVDALVDLADLEMAAGQHRRVRDRLRPVWEEERSQQQLAVPLMRALVATGNTVRAVQIYHDTRDALDELGMDISRELRQTLRFAQYGDPLSTLPMRPARFTGRADELALVDSVARTAVEDGPATLWISGMPGVGKTALAVQAAHRLGEVFPDGRLFVDLTGFTPNVTPATPADALARLLTDLGVPPEAIPQSTAARAELFRSRLAEGRTLVVLDNAASETQIEALLPDTGSALVLVTSRESGALTASDHLRLEPLPEHEAVELFTRLVSADRVRGRVGHVREVVERCGHVPLLIRVVAGQFQRHPTWPLEHLITLLREVSPLSPNTPFPDHAAVACTVSYMQLTHEQQTLLQLFALVPGPDLSASGAAALLGVLLGMPRARALLADLHRVSLLEESAPERFQMLDPLRDYVLAAHPPADRHTAVDRLLDYYLVSTAAANKAAFPLDRPPTVTATCPVAPTFPDRATALAWLDEERHNLVAAVNYAADHDRPDHTWQLSVLLWRYFYTAGHRRDWTETLQRSAAVLHGTENTEGLAHVLLRLSGARWRSGALTEARALAEEALPLWETLGDARGEADTQVAIAAYARNLGDLSTATAMFSTALTKYKDIADERGQANTLDMLGLVSEQHGDLETAEHQHLDAQVLLRKLGHTQGLAHSLDNLGCVRQRLGRLDEALANHLEARQLAVELGDRACEAYALNNIGNTHRLAGRLPEATEYQQQARDVANTVVDPNLKTQLYLDRGETAWAADNDRGALHAYRAALDLSAGTGERAQRARANHRIATVLHATGHHSPTHWQDALTEFIELGLPEAQEITKQLDRMNCACQSSGIPASLRSM